MKPTLTLYYREGCHLCDDMQFVLQSHARDLQFNLSRINIDANTALRQQYNIDVPVLALGDQVICKYFLDMASLKRALAHA